MFLTCVAIGAGAYLVYAILNQRTNSDLHYPENIYYANDKMVYLQGGIGERPTGKVSTKSISGTDVRFVKQGSAWYQLSVPSTA